MPVYIHQRGSRQSADPAVPSEQRTGPDPLGGVNSTARETRSRWARLSVQVLHTPGHSEGSVTLLCGDVLFCGDTLFAGSCGRTDFPGGSYEADDGLSGPAGRPARGLPGLPRPHGAQHPGRGSGSCNPYMQMALRLSEG